MSDANLKYKAVSGMLWVAVQRFGTMILSFISNLILARLLLPEDFGCIGMLTIFIALATTFVDGGFGAALVQKSNPTQDDYSTIFFWNLSLSVVLYVVIWFCAPIIASFYDIQILSDLLRVQALMLIVNSLSIVQRARIRKALRFKVQANVDLISAFLAALSAVVFAYSGMGVWSLVTYQLTLNTCSTIGLWIVEKWRPSRVFNYSSFKSLFRYGSFLLMSDMLNTLCDNIQGLIIGKKFSPTVLGYYTQAKKLEESPTTSLSSVIAQVVFPVFSEIKDDNSALANAHRKCVQAANYINIPLMTLLIIIAYPLICFLYSDKWLESVPYFQILCIGGLANCLQSVNYQLYVAAGYSKSMFKWNILKRFIGLLLIFFGAYFSVKGILWGMVAGMWFTYLINAMLAGRITQYSLIKQIVEIGPIIIIAGVSGIITLIIAHYIHSTLFLDLLLQVTVFTSIYVGISFVFRLNAFELYKGIIVDKLHRIKNNYICKQ